MNNIKKDFLKLKQLIERATKEFEIVCNLVFESVEDQNKRSLMKKMLDTWKDVKNTFKNPDDVKKWFNEKNSEILKFILTSKFPIKVKNLLTSVFNKLKFAIEKDEADINEGIGTFLKKHWLKILVLIYVLVLFIPGASIGYAITGNTLSGALVGGAGSLYYGTLLLLSHIPVIGPSIAALLI